MAAEKDYRKELSFQAGELSPLFYGRSDTEFYDKGLAVAENVTIDIRGGAHRRGGNRNLTRISGNDARIFTKQIHNARFDTIILRDQQMVLLSPGIGYTSANLVTNPFFLSGATGWVPVTLGAGSQVVFGSSICELKPTINPDEVPRTSAIRQELTTVAATVYTLQVLQTSVRRLRLKVGTTAGAIDIGSLEVNEEFSTISFTATGVSTWIDIESNGLNSIGSKLTFVGAVATANLGGDGLTMVAPWLEGQLDQVHQVESPDGEATYFVHPQHPPYKLVYTFATNIYTPLALVVFTVPPAVWAGVNWPGTGTYYQGRLWLAATPNQPQTIWASVSADAENFTVTAAQASSSLEFTLQRFGRLKWMLGTKELIAGSENGEHLFESDGPVITPSDFRVRQQSSYGSADEQALQVGDKVFYMTPDGRKIRAMAYERNSNNWNSIDLTYASEHITEAVGRHFTWAQNPDALLYVTTETGILSVLTYDRTSETVGWTRLIMSNMVVLDIGIGVIEGNSRMVLIGQRIPDNLDIDIETSEEIYMDSFSHVFSAAPGNVIDGLDHLEGQTVQIVVDGAVNPPQVVASGSVTAQQSGLDRYAGVGYNSKISTMPPDVQDGQIRSWKKRWNKVWALMFLSLPPIINGTRPPDRTPSTPMDTPEPARSTHYKAVNLGWDDFGQVTIEEDLPVPMNVLAIYGEMGKGSL